MKHLVIVGSLLLSLIINAAAIGEENPQTEVQILGSFSFEEGGFQKIFEYTGDPSVQPEERLYDMGVWEMIESTQPTRMFPFYAEYNGTISFHIANARCSEDGLCAILQIECIDAYTGERRWCDYAGYYEGYGYPNRVDAGETFLVQVIANPDSSGYHLENNGDKLIFEYHYPLQSGDIYYNYTYDPSSHRPDNNTNNTSFLRADFIWEPEHPSIFDLIIFTSTSEVSGSTIISYDWYLDNQHVDNAINSSSWVWNNPQEGNHTVKLIVTDDTGKTDSYETVIKISGLPQWILLDKTTCKDIKQHEAINRTTLFADGESICVWFKLGNVTGSHLVEFYWHSPNSPSQVARHSTATIPDPKNSNYTMWESYALWDKISIIDNLYTDILAQPGKWTVATYIDGIKEFDFDFYPSGKLDLTVTTDKRAYITGEKVSLNGTLQYANIPVEKGTISAQVYREGLLMYTFPDIITNSSGEFRANYEIPIVPLTNAPPAEEEWSLTVKAKTQQDTQGTQRRNITIKVFPIRLELKDVNLVQVVETPVFTDLGGSYPYLASGREAGIRITIKCPNLPNNLSKPEVTVRFSYALIYGTSPSVEEEKTISVNASSTPVDFIFTLGPGSHILHIEIDPYHKYSDSLTMKDYIKDLTWAKTVISKKMKNLILRFLPVDIPDTTTDPSQMTFYKNQTAFIRDVYPSPKTSIAYRCCSRYDTLFYERTKWTLLNLLATKNLFTGSGDTTVKLVGITPKSWWSPGDYGMACGKYIANAVLVSENAPDYVTGHEVGHTLGLRTWTEEYDLPGYTLGKNITGLILKDGKIFNLSSAKDGVLAFYPTCDPTKAQPPDVHCMMGCSDITAWVCEEDYKRLIAGLRDPPSTQTLFIKGFVHPNGTISLGNCYLLEESSPDMPFGQGEYTIQCLSQDDQVLYSDTFGRKSLTDDPFAFKIPFPEDTKRIVIKKEESIVREIVKTQGLPNVNLLYPTGGEAFNGTVTVAWEATDMDNDRLCYSVLYTHNGGEEWVVPVVETENTTFVLDTSVLPGGSQCRVKIVVTDGFNTGQDISENFTVEDKPPIVYIVAPHNEQRYKPGEEIIFEACGYDHEDFELSDTHLTWCSSRDGIIGTGEHLSLSNLSAGSHRITLVARDSQGQLTEKPITVYVGENQQDTPGFEALLLVITFAIILIGEKKRKNNLSP